MKKSYLFVISGPSAVGKNSVVSEILKMDKSISRIVTSTTRKIRKSECHGKDYFFMTKEDFLKAVKEKKLIEFSEVYGNYYGVKFSSVDEKINNGKDAILVINHEGFLKIKKVIPQNIYGIFIFPPSMEELELRMRLRGEDSPEMIAQRLGLAEEDMEKAKFYDSCFENFDVVATASDILETIDDIRQQKSP
jgi:guanylate kinase